MMQEVEMLPGTTPSIVLKLRGGCWEGLVKLVNEPNLLHDSGGFQDRKKKWLKRLDHINKSIVLDDDDIDFIKRQIINLKGGGWQKQVADIFRGQHPEFSRLPIAPRKKPEDRKRRKTG